jgi:hypothetical protein
VEKLEVFILCDVQQATNVLPSFCVVSVDYCNFVGLFNKNMRLWCSPKCIPNCFEWDLFNVFGSVLPQVLYHFSRQLILSLILEPLSLLCL